MKLLIVLLLVIVNSCFIKGSQLFANFEGSFQDNQCTSANKNGAGFSLVIGQCLTVFGILEYNNPFPNTTNWFLSLSEDKKTLEIKHFEDLDCGGTPLNTQQYTTQTGCVETPPILLANNSLYGFPQFSKLSFGTDKPIYASDSIIFSLYNSDDTPTCDWNDLVFSVAYASGATIYESGDISIKVKCNQVSQAMMFKCNNNVGDCHQSFIDRACTCTGDVSIYCN
ncbi:hypothetical protein DICPUDRAFT_77730 [Dictyostelium purpureum]|uniref:Uncharacterized protein n=1 Tax=Dictyostelium purpureum TaxID=5786 RepID=F0ZHG3_DICPU|nr:uncharacterized protein DICPUDRAFT_77730 [Dictyostelium purpureum]EGC36624.1 hypothetical protein DICPUDRAFT_77730 [Dictyostelium purpureum]|eukprot:XP_003286862.1 hypothetical protein DICPUDRAFT_77730 [Dictyostelium purpureum]